MSELIETGKATEVRKLLLSTVSVLVLMSSLGLGNAQASEVADHPSVWIELGTQLDRVSGNNQPFVPNFLQSPPAFISTTPWQAQRASRYSIGGEGKISFEPEGTNWVFSAAVRYGRSKRSAEVHQSEHVGKHSKYVPGLPPTYSPPTRVNYYNSNTKASQSHAILDFTAGKDFGIGLFGRDGSAVLAGGVRIAQFQSKTSTGIGLRPDLHYYNKYESQPPKYVPAPRFHNYHFSGSSNRSFHGAGPTVTWQASSPFAGSPDTAEMTFDWGINAAVLFGRQKVHTERNTYGAYFTRLAALRFVEPAHYTRAANPPDRTRSVVVPNLGGFAGFSLKFSNAKVSLGYRVDMFFNAIDRGIETRKTIDRSFHGPFAIISIGLGG